MRYRYIVFMVFFFLSTLTVNAQEMFQLSCCIEQALERNFSLKVVRNRQDIADNNFTRGNAGMLPNVNATSRFGGNFDYHTGSASVNLGMTIFRGFQVQTTYQKLGELTELSSLNTQMAIENLVARIAAEYYFYIQQLIHYDNLAYAVSLSRERVRIDEQRYLLGGASKMQLLQSMVYLNADSSRYARQNEVLTASQIRLNELMAAEKLDKNIQLPDTLIHINENLLFDELLEQTLVFNTSLQMAGVNQNITELDYKIISSRQYPYLTFSSGYTYPFAASNNGQTLSGVTYGLNLGVDIFDGYNRRRERSNALIEIENRRIQFSEIEQEVKADLLTIFSAYENNLRLLRLEEQNLEVASENLEIALEQYKLGVLAGIDLREVQKSLLDAEERLISVRYQTKIAEISLMQISGSIMDYL